ncbi:MAG: hypothetical protein LUC94_01505 [Clostridiales bacterium]|nr:hypothetical protein [Clostridiales bacterium]
MKAIGIDIGTTTISGVVLDVDGGNVLEARTMENGSFIKTEQEWERIQDVDVILRKAVELTDALLDCCPEAEAIGLTGQMHGIVYVDRDGRHISPLYTWQDGRGNLPVKDGQQSWRELVSEKTGLSVAAGYGLLTHLYNQRNGLVPRGAVSLCTIGDYLGMALTGRKRPLIHAGNAASLGFFDSRENRFHVDAMREMGIETAILPEFTEDFVSLGTYRKIPVTVAIGDNQASFLGSVGMCRNTLLLNMGTGGQISALSDQYYEAPGIEARPFVKGTYLLVGASLCGGRAYAVLEHFFRSYARAAGLPDSSQYGMMAGLAEEGMKMSDPMQVCTLFNGTRVNPEQRGSITNLSEDNFTPEGLTYGVLEGMARELYDMYRLMCAGTDIEAVHLVASGNGFRRNSVLQEICRRMFGAELSLAAYEEEAACGAAVSGVCTDEKNIE